MIPQVIYGKLCSCFFNNWHDIVITCWVIFILSWWSLVRLDALVPMFIYLWNWHENTFTHMQQSGTIKWREKLLWKCIWNAELCWSHLSWFVALSNISISIPQATFDVSKLVYLSFGLTWLHIEWLLRLVNLWLKKQGKEITQLQFYGHFRQSLERSLESTNINRCGKFEQNGCRLIVWIYWWNRSELLSNFIDWLFWVLCRFGNIPAM